MTKNFRTWEIGRFIRGFGISAKDSLRSILKVWGFDVKRILIAILLVSLLFQTTAYAAVPVYMVNPKSDPGNVFVVNLDEKSIETFMFNLFNKLAARNEDFTASFELQKIEKAREDVSKLMQESIKELHDYGISFGVGQDQVTGGQLLSSIKGNRIINSPFDYLFTEPKEAGRIGGICYYLNVIADQRGWLGQIAGDPFLTTPKATFSDYYSPDLNPITTGGAFNPYTNESVERLWHDLALFLYANDPGPGKQEEFLANESLFLDRPGFDNQSTGPAEMRQRLADCDEIMATYGIDTPKRAAVSSGVYSAFNLNIASVIQDPNKRKEFLLKTFGIPSLIARGPLGEQSRLMRESNNTLGGISSNASDIYGKISSQIATLNQSSFVAGQGLRPENLYRQFIYSINGTPHTYTLNTNYVISPAIILLQKMQAATQAEFDLAGQGYLDLNPNLKANPTTASILSAYNVDSNVLMPGQDPKTSPLNVCNSPPQTDPNVPPVPYCLLLDPWLNPTPSFKTATLDPNSISPSQPIQGGLPAPFEDESSYAHLNTGYRLTDYRNSNSATNIVGDNIGQKELGADYSINDWFDRVLEMYEASGWGTTDYFGSTGLNDWKCYIATWYQKMKNYWQVDSTGTTDWQNFCQPNIDKSY